MSSALTVAGPSRALADLDDVEELWRQLHVHHLHVATYPRLVQDLDASWQRRRAWYERLLNNGGHLFIARDASGRAVGYALIDVVAGPDDTFDVVNGLVELVSLVVAPDVRGAGIGHLLMAGVEKEARALGIDTLKVAVMAGNDGAFRFYESFGFVPAEAVLYRTLEASSG
jgi:ribosomal protein S18 acetylase RimI-like enzyme